MKEQPLFDYYWFGTCLRYLTDTVPGHPIRGDDFVLGNLDAFFVYLEEFDLAVTSRAATELDTFRRELRESEEGAELSSDQAARLTELMSQLRRTLDAELSGFSAFTITPKIVDTKRLLSDVPSLFSPNVFSAIPEIARFDFTEAAKCIAFERATAAAFHILRGTESVLRHFYCALVRQKRVKPQMWGPVVVDLRKRTRTKQHTVLYNNLDNIRISFRNPTQHPEKIYDIHEAQDLWSLCVEVVNRMMRVLRGNGR